MNNLRKLIRKEVRSVMDQFNVSDNVFKKLLHDIETTKKEIKKNYANERRLYSPEEISQQLYDAYRIAREGYQEHRDSMEAYMHNDLKKYKSLDRKAQKKYKEALSILNKHL